MPRTGREPLARELPDTATTRRRACAGLGLVVAMLGLPFAVSALVRSGTMLGLLTGPLAFLLFVELCTERGSTRCSSARLTARTLTGMRSVDLSRITSVRLQTTFAYGTVHRVLLVRDAHGVRLGITSTSGRRTLRRALERQSRAVRRSPPRVSRAARACLGIGRPGQLAVHTGLVFLAQVGLVCAYVVVLVEIGGIG
ncbi:hypothetical protein OG806_02525 [Streptomyces sp. NBC_00882]|uniref:hypothetical protein n=1 Tax=Streptomyces TaxID=1883 RepID=UPI003869E18A|nr:hypothetical protein OG806_02525 [Streptomyces sp. NBC_00882]WSZ55418.1 hypothetical protein OH824_02095 [Streptomyces canus]